MNEPEVIVRTHQYLREQLLHGQSVVRLYTDAYPNLLDYAELRPFQRFSLDMGDFVLHPDLVGQFGDGETLFAVEAKGEDDLLKGLTQAEMYQAGFHYTFLAADAAALGSTYLEFARRKNVGVIAVSDHVTIAHTPEARMPLRKTFQFVNRQMESVIQVAPGQTFQFNIPTHYLVWAIALQSRTSYRFNQCPDLLAGYPIPQDWRSTLAGAQKLGLVHIAGDVFKLTEVGEAVKDMLPFSINSWAQVHQVVGARRTAQTLVQYAPQAAAVLRLLLLQDSMARLIIEGLRTFPGQSANFAVLAQVCDQLDHARAPIFFLKPEALPLLMDDRGRINWGAAQGEFFRSKMFYQYKSILKHAGILKDTRLGGSTTVGYDPQRDLWELR